MFWDSVVAGLKVLAYWETYIAGLEYLAVFMLPMLILGLMMEKGGERGGVAAGCFGMFLLPLLQVAAMAVFILTLSPIIFGFAEDAAWAFPWKVMVLAPGSFFKLIGILCLAAIACAFIPFLGGLQSLQTLVLGGLALMFVLGLLDSIQPGVLTKKVHFIPGFWFLVGLLLVGGIMSWVGMMVSALAITAIEGFSEDLGQILVFPLGAIFGFIPVFMYGAWLGAQVRGGF